MPAAGLGRPWKYVLAVPACSMLKRARRSTAAAAKANTQTQSQPPRLRTAKYMIMPGARPKVIASTRESSSSPNCVPALVARATRPSRASQIPPITT
jgi:hypothetical protein